MGDIKTSSDVRRIFRLIDSDEKKNISDFYNACLERTFKRFESVEEAQVATQSSYGEEDIDIFSNYSGFNYRRINASARGKWSYEKHGHSSFKSRFDELAKDLSAAISNNERSIGNVLVFRGVPLSYFSEYGITSLEELKELEGGFILDRGFVSTSLVEDACFYKRKNELGIDYNVKIEYLVPEEFGDGVSISNVSYSPSQAEYLINTWNLAQVMGVRYDDDNGVIIRTLLIPKYVYDKGYRPQVGVRK